MWQINLMYLCIVNIFAVFMLKRKTSNVKYDLKFK